MSTVGRRATLSGMTIRRAEAPILAAVFLDLLGFGMVIADIQLRAEGMVPKGWHPGWIVGGMLASTFITQLVVSPRWGKLSDQRGRKPVVVACTLLSALSMFTYGIAGSLWVLLLSRILSGLGAANVAVVQAHISDQTELGTRTAALGRIGAAISAGLVLGPPIGGFLAAAGGNHLIGMVAGCASLLGALWMAFALPSVAPSSEQRPGKSPVIDLRLLKDIPALRPYVVIAVVAWLSLATLEGTFARLIAHLYRYDQREFGILFGYESLLGIIVQATLVGFVAKKLSDSNTLRLGYLGQGIGLAINPFAAIFMPTVVPFVLLMVASSLYALGSSLSNPTVNSLCSRMTPDNRQGELFGLLQGTRSIGFVVGPIVGGSLFDWQPAAPYLIAGMVCIGAALLVPKDLPAVPA